VPREYRRNPLSGRAWKFFSVTLAFTALAWGGDEPWRAKPYKEWSEKDLERIFAYSPWSQKAELTRTWQPLRAEELPQLIGGAGRNLPKGLAQSDEGTLGGQVTFNVYWMSSRVMRAASARQNVLTRKLDEAKADESVKQKLNEHQIVIQGADLVPFYRHNEKFYQENSSLETKKSKLKLSPSSVSYERTADGGVIVAVVFHFSKKTAAGEPVIGPDEKGVTFSCKLEGSTMRVNFEPQKMVDKEGPDL